MHAEDEEHRGFHMQPYGSTSASRENTRRVSAISRATIKWRGGVTEFTETLTLIRETKIGKSRNSARSCSDNVITATPYGEMETVFYDYKGKSPSSTGRKNNPTCCHTMRSGVQQHSGLDASFARIFRRVKHRDLVFYPGSGLVFQKEYKAFDMFLGLITALLVVETFSISHREC